MKKIFYVAVIMIATSVYAKDVKTNVKTVKYTGTKVCLNENTLKVSFVDKLKGYDKEGYQGMDIQGDTVISCQNSGWISFYTYNGSKLNQIVPPYKLDCYSKENHCNVVSLSNTYFSPQDKLPLLYVSQCAKQPYKGMKDVLFVVRIANDLKSVQTVQTIYYKDENHHFGYALQWVIDRENNMLYGYGNTVNNNDVSNKHRIVKFRIPDVTEGKDGIVTLTDKDLLENYLLEETYSKPFMPIGQGLFVKNGLLFMPTGFGTPKHPSVLYVWDLKTRQMQNVIDLSTSTFSEFEDCAMWKNVMLLQAQGNMFRLDF